MPTDPRHPVNADAGKTSGTGGAGTNPSSMEPQGPMSMAAAPAGEPAIAPGAAPTEAGATSAAPAVPKEAGAPTAPRVGGDGARVVDAVEGPRVEAERRHDIRDGYDTGRRATEGGPAGGTTASSTLLVVEDLKKHFPITGGLFRRRIGTVYAVDGVGFDVRKGEIFSLVGESGCGKTTLGRSLLRLVEPTAGKITFDGTDLRSLSKNELKKMRRRVQIIFQDPFGSLNPRMPISDIIGEGLFAQGVRSRRERDQRTEKILETVGLRRSYTRRYPHEFSGGQRQRIGIARALVLEPEFVVCDEPVSALDVSIQSQILNLLLDLRRDFNLTYLFISHNLSVVEYFSDRVGVMYLGKVVELAGVDELYHNPRHPYSVALLSAIPHADPRIRRKRLVLKGDLPSPAAPPAGCRFHTRCWLRERLGNPENCSTIEPPLREIGPGHRTACHWAEEISREAVVETAQSQTAADTAVAAEA